MSLDRLVVEVLDSDAVDAATGLQRRMEVQYNPAQVTRSKSVQIAEIAIPGLDSPIQQFIRGQTEKLTLELLFDTAAEGMGEGATSVRTLVDPVSALVRIQPRTHAPPRVRVTWGSGLSMTAIAESVEVKFTLFAPDGTPLRATATVTFRGYRTLREQLAELKLESADHTKRRVVRQGDTLSRIAGEELGDPALWRHIADANPGVDPVDPAPGTLLDIPPVDLTVRAAR